MDVFAAVADPARREVMSALARGDLSAGEVAALFPISRPAVSRHLRVLREPGWRGELVGRRRVYRPTWMAGSVTRGDHPAQQSRFGSSGWPGRLDALETEVRPYPPGTHRLTTITEGAA